MVLEKSFAQMYGFDNTNGLIYEGAGLADCMKYAIKMGQDTYNALQTAIGEKSENIRSQSLNNLKESLKKIEETDPSLRHSAESTELSSYFPDQSIV